jgi:SAM-dependent methyltransferase
MRAFNDLLLARSDIAPGENVLEIGCGTGATTVPLAEAVGQRGRVVGVDRSEPMLAGARQRVAESLLGNISLTRADAQVHRFEAGRFDLITSRFGVMFFADPVAAFSNLLPAARPGGRLCFICWGPLEENEHWLIPYEVALRHLGTPAPTRLMRLARWRSVIVITCVQSSKRPGLPISRSAARPRESLAPPLRKRRSTPAPWALQLD